MTKIKSNLEGIRKMDRMPGAMFLVDTRREHIAVKEARKLGVPTIALIDTDSDPELIDLPIPGNDDAMRAVELILHEISESIIEGKSGRAKQEDEANAAGPRRRSTRSQFRAEGTPGEEGAAPGGAASVDVPAPADQAPVESTSAPAPAPAESAPEASAV
jgi:small subunit ribosomal protein S2